MTSAARTPAFLLLGTLIAQACVAQTARGAGSDPSPHISVTGSATANAPAARGSFSIGIEVLKPTAAAASAETARLTQAVTTALRQAGLAAAELKGNRLTVNAQWSYDDKTRERRRDGFLASNMLLVDSPALERLGSYIDAAMNAGATTVSDISYFPADADGLRREALARAVRTARGEAETIAMAAGGQLGGLVQIDTERAGEIRPMAAMQSITVTGARKGAVPTQVMPSDIEVQATVTAQWQFKQ